MSGWVGEGEREVEAMVKLGCGCDFARLEVPEVCNTDGIDGCCKDFSTLLQLFTKCLEIYPRKQEQVTS